uniref:hypothetical protein n=1 Tax=Streptomyces sp. NBC_01562 TaxID=2975879 RepID=UPI002F9143A9
MAILGHRSAQMSAAYSPISDPVLKEQYEKVIAAGGRIAGPAAEELLSSRIGENTLNRLKTNFFKTELELGPAYGHPPMDPASATSTSAARSSSPPTSTHHACEPDSPERSSSPRTPSNAAGPARSNTTPPSPTASGASSRTSARVPNPPLAITAEPTRALAV